MCCRTVTTVLDVARSHSMLFFMHFIWHYRDSVVSQITWNDFSLSTDEHSLPLKKGISAALANCPKVFPLNCKYFDISCVPLGWQFLCFWLVRDGRPVLHSHPCKYRSRQFEYTKLALLLSVAFINSIYSWQNGHELQLLHNIIAEVILCAISSIFWPKYII